MAITYIAHRGLWNDIYPENSLKAFENAIKHNIPIEFDIQLTKDMQLIVFHDSSLYRMTGVNKKVKDVTLKELQELTLKNSKEKIPTFEEVLNLVNGKVLLDIEIKHYYKPFKTAKIAEKILKNYKGKYMIKSFNPLIPMRYKHLMKKIPCGVLIGSYPDKICKPFKNFLKYFKYSWFYNPDFICYNINDLDDKAMKKIEKKHIPLYLYTLKDDKNIEKAINLSETIVFEKLDIKRLKDNN